MIVSEIYLDIKIGIKILISRYIDVKKIEWII